MAKKENNTKLEVAICDIKSIDSINIESLIRVIRGQQVMLDSDLAMLYGVETKALNQESKSLRSQIVTLKSGRGQHNKYLPYAFTRNGIAHL